MMGRKKTIAIIFSAILALTLFITGCQHSVDSAEVENLTKLCKVWGYVKYRHPAFLLGKKDWDQELLALIPQVREAESAEAVNELLHTWFVSLGEVDYGLGTPPPLWTLAAEEDKVPTADTAWTADAAYLGEALAADLAQVSGPIHGAGPYAPAVNLNSRSMDFFINEPEHEAAYSDAGFRLLGVFRLWNAMEYYFPYLDLLDESWESCLETYIPRMLEGRDRTSYESTLAALAYRLHDGHVYLSGADFRNLLGRYYIPNGLKEAEGKLVVTGTVEGSPLEPGDVLLTANSKNIEALMAERMEYLSCPREVDALGYLAYDITKSKSERIRVTVLRDGQEQTFSVTGSPYHTPLHVSGAPGREAVPTHEILEGNIGLINPAVFVSSKTAQVMEELRDTKGLVVDLRQYPNEEESGMALLGLSNYLGVANEMFLIYGEPSTAVPGTYIKMAYSPNTWDGKGRARTCATQAYPYEQPVVVLMDCVGTQSNGEVSVRMFLMAENTVTIGENSAGVDGPIADLPLPGDLHLTFSARRAYGLDGELIQRTGIAPDIRVTPTIQGIKEGRDEALEAAVEYIKNAQ